MRLLLCLLLDFLQSVIGSGCCICKVISVGEEGQLEVAVEGCAEVLPEAQLFIEVLLFIAAHLLGEGVHKLHKLLRPET